MAAVIDALIAQGVTEFFIAPGSRSSPLTLAAARHAGARVHRHFDERGLAFYAMGSAMGREAPVALIVTSGTAVGNLLPAVMEAHHASIPLVLLTADRPPEWRETSSNQTTDQVNLFAPFVRFQFDLCPSMSPQAIRSQVAHALWRAVSPHPGPVHLNCPLEEPLYPLKEAMTGAAVTVHVAAGGAPGLPALPARGVILAGRLPKRADVHEVLALGKRLGWPVFADVLSQARLHGSAEQVRHFDWLLHHSEAPRPECIVHFGERLVSKRLLSGLSAREYWHVSPHGHWVDPGHLVTRRVAAEVPAACRAMSLGEPPDPEWLSAWQELDELPPPAGRWSETEAVRVLSEAPLGDWAIFLGNSMPIREADWFLFPARAKGFFCNRGLSGIDGNIATAVGLALGLQTGVVALLGDLTTLHDLNSLALLKTSPYPVVLLVSNNRGGGIFSHLPVGRDPKSEELVAFRHDWSFEPAASMFGLPYAAARDSGSFQEALAETIARGTSSILEFVTSREENLQTHQELQRQCFTAPASR